MILIYLLNKKSLSESFLTVAQSCLLFLCKIVIFLYFSICSPFVHLLYDRPCKVEYIDFHKVCTLVRAHTNVWLDEYSRRIFVCQRMH